MMAQPVPHQGTDKKRVKVYELRNNDWFDRGTGFCRATYKPNEGGQKDAIVIVESEDQPERLLLKTKIQKEDGFQKQQDTLIVWQEPTSGVDMALSFQEAEGCAQIWQFINSIQQQFNNSLNGADDGLSEHELAIEVTPTITLPAAEIGNLQEIESSMRIMSSHTTGRDALAKAIMADDYIVKLIPLVEMAEDLESVQDLHRLCNIMKIIILLNDTSIIEHAVSDECVAGVVGALEYDPDFPSHKASHRDWLQKNGRYKEVVPIEDEQTRRKIHQTYRLQYLKDVVLARILDDPTFSVLNSLIFFNQVDIVQHLQQNATFLKDLFGIFTSQENQQKRKDAVLFIQQCCGIAKNIQPPARQHLYTNFLSHGLIPVIHFGLKHTDVAVRVGATDILLSIIDHDPQMIRQTIHRQIHDNQTPLIDALIDLLLVEVDLGVKSQISEAIKVVLDQSPKHPQGPPENQANGDANRPRPQPDPQHEMFLSRFYERSAAKLFQPLIDLKHRTEMNFSVQVASMFGYLIEIMCFFIRQHHNFSRYFLLNNDIIQRVSQLLGSPEKSLQLVAIRFFRSLVALQEGFFIKQLVEKQVLGPVLEVFISTVPRNNLLSSASLDLFEFIKKENMKELIVHIVSNYRERLKSVSHISTFHDILSRYDHGFNVRGDPFADAEVLPSQQAAWRPEARMMSEHIAVDPSEEEYWNTSDPEDEDDKASRTPEKTPTTNGASTPSKPLVDYSSDEEAEENVDPSSEKAQDSDSSIMQNAASSPTAGPPKRKHEEDDDDELGKLMQHKRRNSSSAVSNSSVSSGIARRRKSAAAGSGTASQKKISISLSAGSLGPSLRASESGVDRD